MENKKNIAICGLDCEKCDAFLATKNNDDALREKTAQLWSKLNNVPILPEHINCEGCRIDGIKTYYCSTMCDIRKCAVDRGFETCAECREIDSCSKVANVFENSAEARNNLNNCLCSE